MKEDIEKDEYFRVEHTENKVLSKHENGLPDGRWALNINTFC